MECMDMNGHHHAGVRRALRSCAIAASFQSTAVGAWWMQGLVPGAPGGLGQQAQQVPCVAGRQAPPSPELWSIRASVLTHGNMP